MAQLQYYWTSCFTRFYSQVKIQRFLYQPRTQIGNFLGGRRKHTAYPRIFRTLCKSKYIQLNMDFIRSHFGKMQLWRVEHFFPPFFSRSVLIGGKFIFYKKIHYKICKCCNFNQSALIWKKNGGKKCSTRQSFTFSEVFLMKSIF